MREALLIIDFQNDFCPGGALPVVDGDAIAPRVNELLDSGRFDLVVATRDWHPANHASFVEQGGPWPPHCVQGSQGAELHASLDRSRIDHIVDVGTGVDDEGYDHWAVLTAVDFVAGDHIEIDEMPQMCCIEFPLEQWREVA